MKNVANVVMSKFRLKGITAKAWAEEHGFKPDTLYKTIYGFRGKQDRGESARIREELQREGFWPEDADEDDDVHGARVEASADVRN